MYIVDIENSLFYSRIRLADPFMKISSSLSKKNQGFTLIELLVVIGILAVLMAITIFAINPLEQYNKANDVTTQAASKDFVSAVNYYFAGSKTYPWVTDTACRQQVAGGVNL